MDLTPGTQIDDRYEVVGPLGSGGMGGVYELRGVALGNRLALKLMHRQHASDASFVARFEREARVQARLEHPNIARVLDTVHVHGQPGIVMEFVHGITLRDHMVQARLQPSQVHAFMVELLSALAAAHAAGVVHRDLKPDNIFVQHDDRGRLHVKLIDFGIAKVGVGTMTTVGDSLTRTGDFVGTYRYASPEQVEHSEHVDHRSDLYSLGVIAWELLAGTRPYPHATTPFRVQEAVVNFELPALPDDVPLTLRRLVAELTRKAAEERPQDAAEVLHLLTSGRKNTLDDTVMQAGPPPVSATPIEPTVQRSAPVETPPTPGIEPTVFTTPPARAPTVPHTPPPITDAANPISTPASQPDLARRAIGRGIDEIIPLLSVLTCIGVIAYPILAILREREGVDSWGRKWSGTRVADFATGKAASNSQLMTRNAVDLVTFSGPIALAMWPLFAIFVFPISLLLTLFACVSVGVEMAIAIHSKDGRRFADRLAGTIVIVAP